MNGSFYDLTRPLCNGRPELRRCCGSYPKSMHRDLCPDTFASAIQAVMKSTRNDMVIGLLLCSIVVTASACTIERRRYLSGYHIEFGNRSTRSHTLSARVIREDQAARSPVGLGANAQAKTDPIVSKVDRASDPLPQESGLASLEGLGTVDDEFSVPVEHITTRTTMQGPVIDPLEPAVNVAVVDKEAAPKRKWARLIGLSLLLMALVAGMTVPLLSSMYVAGEVTTTALNVTSDMARYWASVGGWVTILVLDLLAAFGVYRYGREKEPELAKITGASRLLYSIILGAGVIQLMGVSASSTDTAVYHGLDAFNDLWGIGLILFGFHLIALAFLFKKEAGNKWLSTAIFLLLLVAGVSYIVQYTGMLLVPNPVMFTALIEPFVIVPMVLGELSYAIWMLVKGGKAKPSDGSNP